MDADGDFEVDPAIVAAMGFGGFGSQPNKKRKFDRDDGFVDPSARSAAGTGANSVATGTRKPTKLPAEPPREQGSGPDMAMRQKVHQRLPMSQTLLKGDGATTDLQALRHGVRNGRGDVAYFLPSFLEDPWRGLEPK